MAVLPITIFADFTCPFSYVTGAALRRRAAAGDIAVRQRAFELYPAPAVPVSPAEEPGWEEAVRPLAQALELPLRLPAFRPRTRKAHEAACFAREHGVEEALREAIYLAYWGEERDIGRIDVLQELAAELGLDAVDLKIALDIDRFRAAVEGDEELAVRLRIRSVPTLFLGTGAEARVLIGAQTYAELEKAIAREL